MSFQSLQCFTEHADRGFCRGGQCHAMRWGLVPHWSKELSNKYATFNARIEGIESKPAFRSAWRKNQKCLIPALGYYEWRAEEGEKQPYFVRSSDDEPLVFAGLWDECSIDDGTLTSCTVITTEAKDELQQLHTRMPVMLNSQSAKQWLTKVGGADFLLNECLSDVNVIKVDKRVNNSRQEDAELVVPIE